MKNFKKKTFIERRLSVVGEPHRRKKEQEKEQKRVDKRESTTEMGV